MTARKSPDTKRPNVRGKEANIELDKIQDQFVEKENEMANLTMQERQNIPLQEEDSQTKLSKKELEEMGCLMIKPYRSIGSSQKPNSKWQKEREHDWKLVKAILENKESPGEDIEMCTHPYKGDNYDFWKLPTNKPILIPRHVANDVASCNYVQFKMEPNEKQIVNEDGAATYIGKMVAKTRKSRLTAQPHVDSFKEATF